MHNAMKERTQFSEKQIKAIEEKLEALSREFDRKGAVNAQEKILDHSDFLRLLNISPRTSQYWREHGRIPYSRINRKLYFRLSDIMQLMQESRVSGGASCQNGQAELISSAKRPTE